MQSNSPGTIIESIQHELGYTGKELAACLNISEVWVSQLTRDRALPSFHLLNNLLTLYLSHANTDTRAHRQCMSKVLLQRCSDLYIQQHLRRITAKAANLFQHDTLIALTNTHS